MSKDWIPLLFNTSELGVSSAISPELLPDNQSAWAMNAAFRGSKPATRPNLCMRLALPGGLIQGGEFFGVQGGMIVAAIAGRLFRIRVDGPSFSWQEIPLTFPNSPIIKQVWMTQTVESLVVQDGQSDAILYDGSTAQRAGPTQVPRGRQMAYLNGRLWVAVNAYEALAGDIRTGAPGSELYFTEATYLTGGGKLFFPSGITGMAGIPVTGQADYGALLIFGSTQTNAVRADITARDDWGKIPGFVTAILRSVGAASQWSLVAVNQDLYWRDSNGGIRSIRNALADEAGPGSAPISREVRRLTDFDSQQLLPFCSAVYFNNRLLMTSSPYLIPNGGIGWKDIIPLDFAPISTMGGKSQPAYDGKWNGLNFIKLVGGVFRNKNRAFTLVTDDAGNNQLWEFETGNRADLILDCNDGTSDGTGSFTDGTSDGSADFAVMENRITTYVEYPLRDFGRPKVRKRLERCDIWMSSLDGDVEIKVYWRPDNSQRWLLWDDASTCAKTSDPATTTPHVWKNLTTQYRPQFKTFTIPDFTKDVVKYAAQVGFQFQMRLVWIGRVRIDRMMVYATALDDPDYADRAGFDAECVQEEVGESNEIAYTLRTNCLECELTYEVQPVQTIVPVDGDGSFTVEITTTADNAAYQWQVSEDGGTTWTDLEDGEHYAGVNTDTLSLSAVPADWDGFLYRVGVYLAGCSATSFKSEAAELLVAGFVDCATFEGSVRGGVYTLIGYSEYSGTSNRKWLTQTIGGSQLGCASPGGPGTCSSGLGYQSTRYDYSGSYAINPITAVGVNTQNEKTNQNTAGVDVCGAGMIPGADAVMTQNFTPPQFDPAHGSIISLATEVSYIGDGVCYYLGFAAAYGSQNGTVTKSLSIADTEQNAINRLLAGASWSAYGVTPLARWETNRAANDFDGVYVEARYQGTVSVPEGSARFVRIGIYRRLFGVGSYVLLGYEDYPVIGGPGNVGTFSGTVPTASGYETYAECLDQP